MHNVRYNLLEDGASVEDVIKSIVERGSMIDPVHILNLDDVVAKHRKWLELLPRIEPFYAVKCNDDPAILKTLIAVGAGFDCASKQEIEHDKPIDSFAKTINLALQRFFPVKSNVRIIAEPGRYYVASAVTVVTNVQSKRVIRTPEGTNADMMYYLNDGVFGSFGMFIPREYPPVVKQGSRQVVRSPDKFPSTLWGPTCHSKDLILTGMPMEELHVGDFLVFDNMGAYGMTMATTFNGFSKATVLVYISRRTWEQLKLVKRDNREIY